MHLDDPDGVIGDFLGGGPRASEWRELWQTLKDRLLAAKDQLATATEPAQIVHLKTQIAGMERQIAVLQQEEVVTEFVENSVKAALSRPSLSDLEDEE